ncbi:MAG: glycosyltransferase family 4 protein [Planctomycetota bacterium]
MRSLTRRFVFFTAGAAGMYCGSCMHDNALAKAIIAEGHECLLQPLYTPIRSDETSIASDNVFFGGIHIYALQKMPWLSSLPRFARRWLDSPRLLRRITAGDHKTSPKALGELTVSMMRGTDGRQADEVRRLIRWLRDEIKPDAVLYSNLLIAGSLPAIQDALPDVRSALILQGDDIFIEYLPEPYRQQVLDLGHNLVSRFDHTWSNSRFYADSMADRLAIKGSSIETLPLTIDIGAYSNPPATSDESPTSFDLGFLARIAPEKGLHHLVDAFCHMGNEDEHDDLQLHVAGWLGKDHQDYLDEQLDKISAAGLSHRMTHYGSIDLNEKVRFLNRLDALCVPTDYQDPKGLFALESMASGTPVVLPDHGAFPELIQSTGGGLLYRSGDDAALRQTLTRLKNDPGLKRDLAETGRRAVLEKHNIQVAARHVLESL